ncbi:MAG: hypothetical protein AVDCRST_MAG79-1987, partial [uncultured Thermoleophilia bacterium]
WTTRITSRCCAPASQPAAARGPISALVAVPSRSRSPTCSAREPASSPWTATRARCRSRHGRWPGAFRSSGWSSASRTSESRWRCRRSTGSSWPTRSISSRRTSSRRWSVGSRPTSAPAAGGSSSSTTRTRATGGSRIPSGRRVGHASPPRQGSSRRARSDGSRAAGSARSTRRSASARPAQPTP